MGWEYYADSISDINYRGNIGYLWKANFAQIYQDLNNKLSKIMAFKVPYLNEVDNVDEIFLLTK